MRLDRSKRLINGLCLLSLIIAALARNDGISSALTLACLLCALAVFYRNLPALSNVSPGSPKARTVRFAAIFSVCYIAAVLVFVQLVKRGVFVPSVQQSKYIISALVAVPILVFGNIAPKLPFSRYTGLRLPWTVRDEDTWVVAHRILGYVSIPIGLLCFVGATMQMNLELWVKVWVLGPVFTLIAIPGLLSGIFYWKKWSGRL